MQRVPTACLGRCERKDRQDARGVQRDTWTAGTGSSLSRKWVAMLRPEPIAAAAWLPKSHCKRVSHQETSCDGQQVREGMRPSRTHPLNNTFELEIRKERHDSIRSFLNPHSDFAKMVLLLLPWYSWAVKMPLLKAVGPPTHMWVGQPSAENSRVPLLAASGVASHSDTQVTKGPGIQTQISLQNLYTVVCRLAWSRSTRKHFWAIYYTCVCTLIFP